MWEKLMTYYTQNEKTFNFLGLIISLWIGISLWVVQTFIINKKNKIIGFASSIIIPILILVLAIYQININDILIILLFILTFSLSFVYYKLKKFKTEIANLSEEVKFNLETLKKLEIEKAKVKELSSELEKTKSPQFNSVTKKRFESIKILKYGFVEYSPFFWKERSDHKGIGIDVLNKVFENKIKLERHRYEMGVDGSNWDNIFDQLAEKKFDIIITPLFETRSRLYQDIAFCSPLFYSNIGIYVSKESIRNISTNKKMAFNNAISFLKEQIETKQWKPEILKGEIGESIALKYNLINSEQLKMLESKKTATDNDFVRILEDMSSDSNEFGDFTFMEVFKAESIIKENNTVKVVNILKDNELLYPVSFVLRKEDTVLRNLINLRLLELRQKGDLKTIIKNVANVVKIEDVDFERIFVQKYELENL